MDLTVTPLPTLPYCKGMRRLTATAEQNRHGLSPPLEVRGPGGVMNAIEVAVTLRKLGSVP